MLLAFFPLYVLDGRTRARTLDPLIKSQPELQYCHSPFRHVQLSIPIEHTGKLPPSERS